MFKKISMYILCIAMVLSLVACSAGSDNSSENNATSKATGGSPADNTGSEESESTPKKDEGETEKLTKDAVSYNNFVLKIGMVINEDVISKIGEPTDIQNADSCIGDGQDIIYSYQDLDLQTFKSEDKEVLYSIVINTDSVATADGIRVGNTYDEVKNVYGTPEEETVAFVSYKVEEDRWITFYLTDNVVESIEYL